MRSIKSRSSETQTIARHEYIDAMSPLLEISAMPGAISIRIQTEKGSLFDFDSSSRLITGKYAITNIDCIARLVAKWLRVITQNPIIAKTAIRQPLSNAVNREFFSPKSKMAIDTVTTKTKSVAFSILSQMLKLPSARYVTRLMNTAIEKNIHIANAG
jgi:hypothetical protein